MPNPFPKHADWKAEKKKYGIPDRVIKSGEFGKKVDALHQQFAKGGFEQPSPGKAAAAAVMFEQATKLYKEWIQGAKALKPEAFKNGNPSKDGKVNKDKAIKLVEGYASFVDVFEKRYASLKDPFLSARIGGRKKCWDFYRIAEQDPFKAESLERLYGQGVRNDLGMTLRKAHTEGTYDKVPAIAKMLADYDAGVARYNKLMMGGGSASIAESPAKQKKFMADMKDLMDLGDRILAATKP